ncbi:MAG: DUF2306 domain-containing protein [Planctomycetes bacterium]|nr:DUF2306 domain-containing protein [Planctomycetota bacterium]
MSTATAPVRRSGSPAKLAFFVVFGLLTVFVLVAKNAKIFDPSSEIAQHFAPVKPYLAVHGAAGMLALLLGAFQISNRLRAKFLPLHRKLGYLYVLCVYVSAPFAIPVAMKTSNLSLTAASAVQSFGWALCTTIALYCIKQGNLEQHRRWMLRGYPFAMVFTVARLIIPIPPIFKLGLPGIELVVWTTIALAALLPSLLLDWPAKAARPLES